MGRCHIIKNSGPPTDPPSFAGDHYIDETNNTHYLSVGTNSVNDWVEIKNDTDTDVNLYNCEATVAVGDFVYVSGNNEVKSAIANDDTKKYAIGLVSSKPSGTTAIVQTNGRSSTLSGLTAGLPIFLSDSLAGGYTQTPITASGNWLQVLGMATDGTTITIEPDVPIKRQ